MTATLETDVSLYMLYGSFVMERPTDGYVGGELLSILA